MGKKSSGREIFQVEGGHIVQSIGRKDRRSKVFTAKGPRDRRVRLAAHTAIQFYDVQDRLGYDRPSKAVDWLINKAKTAIDKLAELPPWNPTAHAPGADAGGLEEEDEEEESPGVGFNEMTIFQVRNQQLADPMKTLFTTSNPVEDLGLSLHSIQDQNLIHGQSHQANTSHSVNSNEQTIFSAPSGLAGFESAGSFQRMMGCGNDARGVESRVSAGFAFNPAQFYHQQQQQQQQQMMLWHSPAFSQGGTLQSNFFQSLRAWNDLADHSRATQDLHHQSLVFGSRFVPEGLSSGFTIHGEDEQSPRIVSDRQTSSSSSVSQQ